MAEVYIPEKDINKDIMLSNPVRSVLGGGDGKGGFMRGSRNSFSQGDFSDHLMAG